MFAWTQNDSSHMMDIVNAWAGVAKVAANELKRTLKNTTLVMNMWLDPRLKTKGQIDALFAKHDKAIEKINKDTKEIMDSICKGAACKEADMMMLLANPAFWITMKVRDNVKSITPQKIDNFFDETGLNDVPIIGGMMQWTAKKAVAAGQIATLTSHEYGTGGGGADGAPGGAAAPDPQKRSLFDRLYGIFLLQNPMAEHHWLGDNLLTEQNAFRVLLEQDEKEEAEDEKKGAEDKDETDEFQTLLISIGVNEEMQKKLGDPFVKAHKEFADELVDHLEESVQDAVAMAKAKTLDDFLKVFADAKAPELKSIDVGNIKDELMSGAQEIVSNNEALAEFLEAGGKTLEDFGIESPGKLKEQDKPEGEQEPETEPAPEEQAEPKPEGEPEPAEDTEEAPGDLTSNEKLIEFIMQGLYDQNVAPERQKIFEGVGDLFESGWLYILNGLDEDKLDDLRGTPTGDQLYQIITTGRDRLMVIFEELKAVQ